MIFSNILGGGALSKILEAQQTAQVYKEHPERIRLWQRNINSYSVYL